MDEVLYILALIMLSLWLLLILFWRYIYVFKAFVKDASRVLNRVKKGDFSARLKNLTGSELTFFINNFNSMLYYLEHLFHEVDKKNRQLDAIIKSVSNGIIVIDIDNKVYLINSLARDYIDCNQEGKIEGMPISSVVNNDILLEFIIYNTGINTSVYKEIRCLNGKTFKVKIDPVKINPKKDIVISSVINIEDITERIKLENIRKDFAANVSHELKTPLTSIQGFIETLKMNDETIDSDTRKRFLDIIDNESSRLRILINDILMLSSIEGDIVLSMEDIDLEYENKKIIDLFQDKASKKNIHVSFIYNGLKTIYSHREYYRELIINLVSNGIKYNRPGGYVRVTFFEDDTSYLIDVEDNGIGIGKEEQDRIFERFYRATKSRDREIEGTGLGMAIVKHIIVSLGGSINLESSINNGSKFKISLPKKLKI